MKYPSEALHNSMWDQKKSLHCSAKSNELTLKMITGYLYALGEEEGELWGEYDKDDKIHGNAMQTSDDRVEANKVLYSCLPGWIVDFYKDGFITAYEQSNPIELCPCCGQEVKNA